MHICALTLVQPKLEWTEYKIYINEVSYVIHYSYVKKRAVERRERRSNSKFKDDQVINYNNYA